jgi:hypothetical protein
MSFGPLRRSPASREGGFVGEDGSQSFLRSKRSNAPQFAKPVPECAYVIAGEQPRETVGRPARELAKTTPGADGGSKIGNPSSPAARNLRLRRHKRCEVVRIDQNLVRFWSGVSRKSRQPIRDFSEGKGDQNVQIPKCAYFFSSV